MSSDVDKEGEEKDVERALRVLLHLDKSCETGYEGQMKICRTSAASVCLSRSSSPIGRRTGGKNAEEGDGREAWPRVEDPYVFVRAFGNGTDDIEKVELTMDFSSRETRTQGIVPGVMAELFNMPQSKSSLAEKVSGLSDLDRDQTTETGLLTHGSSIGYDDEGGAVCGRFEARIRRIGVVEVRGEDEIGKCENRGGALLIRVDYLKS